MEKGENEMGWKNEISNGESLIEIQINKPTTRLSISSTPASTNSSPSPKIEMQTAVTIFSSGSSCFSAYSCSVMRLTMKLGCMSIVGVIREKMNVGEKWILKVMHGRRRNKSSMQYYCQAASSQTEEKLTDDSIKAAIAYCNASSSLSPLQLLNK